MVRHKAHPLRLTTTLAIAARNSAAITQTRLSGLGREKDICLFFYEPITFLSNTLNISLLCQVIVILNLSLLSLTVKQVILPSKTLSFAV